MVRWLGRPSTLPYRPLVVTDAGASQQQPPVPQPHPAAIGSSAEGCGADGDAARAGLTAFAITLCMPSATACVAVRETSDRPASRRPDSNSTEREGSGDAADV